MPSSALTPPESVEEERVSAERLEAGLRAVVPSAARGLDRSLGLKRIFMAINVAKPTTIRIGRYVVEERLGQGGMGSVYRARDPELRRDVAIKLLQREVTPADTALIRDEAKTLARLAHPNVVSVYDLGVTDGQLYVVMQYVKGTDLRRRLLGSHPPSAREAIGLFIEAGRGLAAAHAAGIIHRDFKPENVLVSEDSKVLLADFGLARRTERGVEGEEIAGTFDYMAPEVQQGRPADVRSDQYSFCASVWRMLDPRSKPGTESKALSEPVARVLTRGLEREPHRRWPSMEILLGALEQALDELPLVRQRGILLDRVERNWIAGVLHSCTDETGLFEVPIAPAHDEVERPWSTLLPMRDELIRTTDDLEPLLEIGNGSLLVLGQAGAGKTTALLRLAARMVETARIEHGAPIPVVLNLSSFGVHEGSLRAWIAGEIVTKYSLPRRTVDAWIAEDALALLFDGLDEMDTSRRAGCIDAINAYRAEHSTMVVVVCRTDEYRAVGTRLAFGSAVEIQPLSAAEVDVVLRDVAGSSSTRLLLEADDGDRLRTPLMVGLLGRARPSPAGRTPELSALYDAYLQQAFVRHGVPEREQSRMLEGLGWLARAIERVGTSEVWIEQLSASWLSGSGARVAARALGVVFVYAASILILTMATAASEHRATVGPPIGACAATFGLIFNRGFGIHPVGRLQWAWRRAVRWLPVAMGLGAALGALYGLLFVVWINVIFGAAAGLLCALSIGLEPAELESSVRPNQGIRQSAANAAGVAALGAVVGGLVLGYGVVPLIYPHLDARSMLLGMDDPQFATALAGGSLVGVAVGLLHGGTAVLLHAGVRVVLALTSALPLRLQRFLDEGVRLAILRRVGGGYIFLHRTLQEHLAQQQGAVAPSREPRPRTDA